MLSSQRLALSRCPSLVCLLLLVQPSYSLPLPLASWITDLLGDLEPEKGATFADEIKCYSLPYGSLGFISHLLTYWAILWLGFCRSPWCFRKLKAGWFDLFLAIGQLVITAIIAAFTMYRCRNRWQFVLIALWKLVLSVFVGLWSIQASKNAMKNKKTRKRNKQTKSQRQSYELLPNYGQNHDQNNRPHPMGTFGEAIQEKYKMIWGQDVKTQSTLVIYGAAGIIGIVGVASLVIQEWEDPTIRTITMAFGIALGAGVVVCMLLGWCISETHSFMGILGGGFIGVALAVLCTVFGLGALYSDWVLAAIAGNLLGIPDMNEKFTSGLYWTYFVAKRLPLLFT